MLSPLPITTNVASLNFLEGKRRYNELVAWPGGQSTRLGQHGHLSDRNQDQQSEHFFWALSPTIALVNLLRQPFQRNQCWKKHPRPDRASHRNSSVAEEMLWLDFEFYPVLGNKFGVRGSVEHQILSRETLKHQSLQWNFTRYFMASVTSDVNSFLGKQEYKVDALL